MSNSSVSTPITESAPKQFFPKAAPNSMVASLLLAFLSSAGLYYVNIFPAITDALMVGAGLNASDAGQITSANAMGAAFGAFTITLLIKKLPQWKLVAVGLLLMLISIDIFTILQESTAILVPIRFSHGFMGGALVGLGFSVIARTAKPSVAFSLLLVVQFGGGALGLWLLPPLVPEFGPYVPFYALITFSVVTLVLMCFLGEYPLPAAKVAGDSHKVSAPIEYRPLCFTLLALFLFQAANMALFAFIFGMGKHYGHTIETLSPMIGIANIVAIGGPVLAIFTAVKFKLLKPLTIALVTSGVSTLLFLFSASESIYLIANCITGVAWAFCIPYFLTMAAKFDEAGQMAALGGFASKMGLACGPLAAGYMLGSDNYSRLIIVAAIVIGVVVVISVYPARNLDSKI
ncbi:MAG: MFS transporter [Pseudomonadales bacterium]